MLLLPMRRLWNSLAQLEEESREVTVDGQHHSDTPGEEGELAKDDVLGGPTENTIEDEVNQEGVEAFLDISASSLLQRCQF